MPGSSSAFPLIECSYDCTAYDVCCCVLADDLFQTCRDLDGAADLPDMHRLNGLPIRKIEDVILDQVGNDLSATAYSTASDRLFQQHPTSCSTIIRPVGGSGLRQSLHG